MSKSVKSVATIALPIAGAFLLPGVGGALGASLSASLGAAGTSALGGALGGVAGGYLSGGGTRAALRGGVVGGVGGYLAGGGLNQLGITGPGSILGEAAQPGVYGPGLTGAPVAEGSGFLGTVTRNLPSSILSGGADSLSTPIVAGNLVSGVLGANATENAAKLQYQATQDALAQQRELSGPYVNAGTQALTQYQDLLNNPESQKNFIQNNPFYNSLADEAQRRLLASQATTGKLASGGTQAALQDRLLALGNNLVQQRLGNLRDQINVGYNASTGYGNNYADLTTQGGNAQAAGEIGGYNVGNSAYQNTISSLLALQKLKQSQSAPTYLVG